MPTTVVLLGTQPNGFSFLPTALLRLSEMWMHEIFLAGPRSHCVLWLRDRVQFYKAC